MSIWSIFIIQEIDPSPLPLFAFKIEKHLCLFVFTVCCFQKKVAYNKTLVIQWNSCEYRYTFFSELCHLCIIGQCRMSCVQLFCNVVCYPTKSKIASLKRNSLLFKRRVIFHDCFLYFCTLLRYVATIDYYFIFKSQYFCLYFLFCRLSLVIVAYKNGFYDAFSE